MSDIKTLADITLGEYIKAMFVGRTGSWKTGAIGSFPEPIKILNFDGIDRMATIKALWPNKDMCFKNFSHKHTHEIEAALDEIVAKPKQFATYGFDSYTFFMQHAIKYGMKHANADTVGQMKVAGLKQFNVEAAAANNLYDIVQEIKDCHFLMTAHFIDKITQAPDGSQKTTRRLATAGNTPGTLMPGVFSEVWSFHLDPAIRQGDEPKAYIITQSGSEQTISTLEKSALAAAGALPVRLEYGKDLYGALKASLDKKGFSLK